MKKTVLYGLLAALVFSNDLVAATERLVPQCGAFSGGFALLYSWAMPCFTSNKNIWLGLAGLTTLGASILVCYWVARKNKKSHNKDQRTGDENIPLNPNVVSQRESPNKDHDGDSNENDRPKKQVTFPKPKVMNNCDLNLLDRARKLHKKLYGSLPPEHWTAAIIVTLIQIEQSSEFSSADENNTILQRW